jgi:DNA-binding transcriptional LysR family regulator
MELRHLRYFIAVAEELHFGRAARRLRLAQPPLSQQIRSLEEKLGLRLFHRTSRKVELTPEGSAFLERARLVLSHADGAFEFGRAASRGEAGRLAIGFVTSAVYNLVPDILREFHRVRPKVQIRCFEMNPEEQLIALRHHKLDVAFVRTPVREEGLESMLLAHEPLVLARSAGEGEEAAGGPVRLADFKAEEFIMLPRTLAPLYHDLVVTACQRAGFQPRFNQEAGEWQTALALVAAGLGVMLVPESLRRWRRPGVAYHALRTRTGELSLELVWRHAGPQPLVEAFAATAKVVAAGTRGLSG